MRRAPALVLLAGACGPALRPGDGDGGAGETGATAASMSTSTLGASASGVASTGGADETTTSTSDGADFPEPPKPTDCGDAVLHDAWLHIDAGEWDERDELDGVAVIDGDVVIRRSDLVDLGIFACVREITGSLHIYDNDALVDVTGLYWLERIGGDVVVFDNDALVEFDALAKITEIEREEPDERGHSHHVDHGIAFIRNASLTRIRGLTDVTAIWGDLMIRDNPALVSLDGLVGLKAVIGTFAINHNASLCQSAVSAVGLGIVQPSPPPPDWSATGNDEDC